MCWNVRIQCHPQRGLTAIELMVTVALIAILGALAAPSFTPIFDRWRVRQVAEELQASLYFARSEAIKRGGSISLSKLPNAGDCTNAVDPTQWGCGWQVLNGAVVLQQSAAPNRVIVSLNGSNGSLMVDRWGQITSNGSTAFDFRIMPQGAGTSHPAATALCVSGGGRIRRLATGDQAC